MVSEAVEGKGLAKVRTPDVNIITLVVKWASGPEVGIWPAVTTIPCLRMLASCVRGVFLLVVGAGDTCSWKPIRG